ncbi:hypothetical protein C8R45DRAFT_1012970 [Mycena sanguinolenta]|nr:hypothetical protein C8R45DRAFT_1012970 [Mycena sanguinolenta]
MPFEALGEDVLLRVFSICDISTALVVSTINKALRRIALSKQLWISLVLGPTFRDALALPPPDREQLECLSTEELIDVVKNAVAGPGSDWDSSITITSFQIPLDMGFGIPEFRFLPGARYIFMHSTSQQMLCIYDVWSSRRVWHSPVQAQTQWEVDLLPCGTIARVFVAQMAVLPNRNTLHVEEVDLSTGASHELFNFGFASPVPRIMPSAIVGDLLCILLYFNDPTIVLVNWHASTFAFVGRMGSNIQLIPGYIISTYRESGPPYKHFLSVRALEAFSAHWQRLTEDNLASRVDGSAPASDITIGAIVMQARLEHSGLPLGPHFVTATLDALHSGRYNIFVRCRLQSSEPPLRSVTLMERIGNLIRMATPRKKASPKPGRMLLSYKFTPGQGQDGSKLRPASAQRGANPLQSPGVMFTLGLRNLVDIVYCQRRADVA